MTTQQLYFAYGSNMHLDQMKRRCPESKYIGTGRLMNYRWQINKRGYANVVKADGYWVDGLCYDISPSDEARLDISEGVSKGAYKKQMLSVEVLRAEVCLYRRPTAWIVDTGGVGQILQSAGKSASCSTSPSGVEPDMLVYVSDNFVEDGEPWDEYVHRINAGLQDARYLGMEASYIDNCIRPFIPESLEQRAANAE